MKLGSKLLKYFTEQKLHRNNYFKMYDILFCKVLVTLWLLWVIQGKKQNISFILSRIAVIYFTI